jgi:hypothetical protein
VTASVTTASQSRHSPADRSQHPVLLLYRAALRLFRLSWGIL